MLGLFFIYSGKFTIAIMTARDHTENKFMNPNITCQVTGPFKHFGDKFGDYVFSGYPMRIDDFIRRLPDKEEVTYWLGGTVDYHF